MRAAFLSTVFLAASIGLPNVVDAQPPGQPLPEGIRYGSETVPEAGVEIRTYRFEDTGEDLPYSVFVSSKVQPDVPAPLIIGLRGFTGTTLTLVRGTARDLAEEGGYILVGPIGYNNRAGFGVMPRARAGGPPAAATGARGAAPGRGAAPPGAAPGRGAAAPAGRGMPPVIGGTAETDPVRVTELSEKDVMNVLAMMREEFNVDPNRIYLTGHSMGGAGTYYLGAEHADIWAAIAPVAPAAFMMTGNRAELLKKVADAGIPVMVVHGADDEVVNVSISRDEWVPTMKELGIEHEYVEQPGITHGPVITSSQEDIFRFFGAHSKK